MKNSDTPQSALRLVFNATSLRPGGGLTILLGILKGLAEYEGANVESIVICSAGETADAIREQGIANQVLLRCENQSMWRRQWFVFTRLGRLVNSLDADAFLSINQFVRNVRCPQIVYHLNLLRFLPIDRSKGWRHSFAEWIRNRGTQAAIQKADANIFESKYLLECATACYGEPRGESEVIYIGLPDDLIESASTRSPKSAQCSCFMAITNHNEHKDNPTLIRTLHTLTRQYPDVDWQLKIAGSIFPEKWKPFRDLASELGVESRISWLGFVSQKQLTDHLQSSLCLVSTSRIESFCMVALEAMARGCPAVVADASSMPESVGDAGVLVQPGDENGFAEAVATFFHEPDVREDFVNFGFDRIKTFRWNTCGQQFGQLISKLKVLSQKAN